jgi:hypothetical protein
MAYLGKWWPSSRYKEAISSLAAKLVFWRFLVDRGGAGSAGAYLVCVWPHNGIGPTVVSDLALDHRSGDSVPGDKVGVLVGH